MEHKIAIIKGDGVGPEIIDQAILVLKRIEKKFGHKFKLEEVLAGGAAIDKYGECLPEKTLEVCKGSDAILLGAVGGPKWDNLDGDKRPERALLGLRKELGLYANIRPAKMYKELKDSSPLKEEIIKDGIDISIIRELTGGIYFGEKGRNEKESYIEAYDVEKYNEKEVRRIAKIGFEVARGRNKRLTSVDKANVLESSRLWRSVVEEVAKDYDDVQLNHMYVDNAAMQLVRNPQQFDVILTNNIFGDILSDEASMITGSIGMLPSASLGEDKIGMYEPIHGSAPDIAGKEIVNPIATILSLAMMFRYSLNLEDEAIVIESAVNSVLGKGYRTIDIMSDGMTKVGTKRMGELIVENI